MLYLDNNHVHNHGIASWTRIEHRREIFVPWVMMDHRRLVARPYSKAYQEQVGALQSTTDGNPRDPAAH